MKCVSFDLGFCHMLFELGAFRLENSNGINLKIASGFSHWLGDLYICIDETAVGRM